MTPPFGSQVDIPLLGPATIVEQFAGPHGFCFFACWTAPGTYCIVYRTGRDRRRDMWLVASLPLERLMALLTGRVGLREAMEDSPGGQLARLAVGARWADATAELLPIKAVAEELPPPDLRVDRAWMKGGHSWYVPIRPAVMARDQDEPASPVAPPEGKTRAAARQARKPAAASRSGRDGTRRMKVWLADGGRS